jgi:hypothetical protein
MFHVKHKIFLSLILNWINFITTITENIKKYTLVYFGVKIWEKKIFLFFCLS